MAYWYICEVRMLVQYSIGWALRYGVPGRRWLIIPLFVQGLLLATGWLIASPIIRYYRPPTLDSWFVGRCHKYMLGD